MKNQLIFFRETFNTAWRFCNVFRTAIVFVFFGAMFIIFKLNWSRKNSFDKIFFGYIKCLAYFIIDVSYYYMKIIGVFLIWYQALFFSNLIPNFIQRFLSFHFLFNFLWDLFLLLIIYSSFLVCLPMFVWFVCFTI